MGATTRAGLLTSPLRDRFGIVQRLEFYSVADLTTIVERSAKILGMNMESEGAHEVARVQGVRHVLLTACCDGCVIMPRCGPMVYLW